MANQRLLVYKSSAGTGKTFTLAAYYVSLLLCGVPHRSLLAVTFTNKATAEMKERILTHLYLLQKCAIDPKIKENEAPFLALVKSFMKEAGFCLPKGESDVYTYVYKTAGELFPRMIEDYDGMAVTTIDSFLQQLLQGLAHAINTAAGYRVDLDSPHAVAIAIDQIMSSHIDEQPGLMEAVVAYVNERLEEEGNWDVRSNMRKLADELFKESLQAKADSMHTEPEAMKALREAVGNWKKGPEYLRAKEICDDLQHYQLSIAAMKNGSVLCNFVKNMELSLLGEADKDKFFPALGSKGLGQIAKTPTNSEEIHCYPLIRDLNELGPALRAQYLREKHTLAHLHDMMMLAYIREQIRRNQEEDNSLLLADTAHLLSQALRPGDADFILEKAGLRYKHVMLDEFQDTSRLQWENFKPLLQEVMGAGGSVFIVGDIKQSIYRWRNGDWHIMNALSEGRELGKAEVRELPVNRRSLQEVIRFNLETMRKLTQKNGEADVIASGITDDEAALYDEGFDGDNIDSYSVKGKTRGYVQITAYPHSARQNDKNPSKEEQKNALLAKMFDTVSDLIKKGASASDCLILCRTKKEAKDVIRAFAKAQSENEILSSVGMASADSFLLEASPSVCVVINALRYCLRNDSAALHYVENATGRSLREQLLKINMHLPLLDLLERIIELCLCTDGKCECSDIVYLDALKDKTRAYVGSYGADADAFLSYYDDKMHEDPVPATMQNSIRLMTIHKSKGLEGRFVFIPFCQWKLVDPKGLLWSEPATNPVMDNYIAVKNTVSLTETCTEAEATDAPSLGNYKAAYIRECAEERIDALNMLYVALTRAREALYISMLQEVPKERTRKEDVGCLLLESRDMLSKMYELYDKWQGGPCVVEKSIGYDPASEPISSSAERASDSPFATAELEGNRIEGTYYSENHDIRFVQSQESMSYGVDGLPENTRFGSICHDILAEMATREDQLAAVARFRLRGIIETDEEEKRINEAISKAWENEHMCRWFDGSWELMREDSILVVENHQAKEYRPDRVMLKDKDEAIILDYKFGQEHPKKYANQLRGYMHLLQGLGRTKVTAYLWYAQEGKLVPVTLN